VQSIILAAFQQFSTVIMKCSKVRRITVLRFLSAETRNDVTAIRKDLYQYFETMLEPQS
jgi:hypothetical protein